MKHIGINDTISAISTPIGEGGIGIIRLSGGESINIVKKIFLPKGHKRTFKPSTYNMYYGHIIDKNRKIIDEVILTVMLAPRSYTREDVVEINCHSGIAPLRKILGLVIMNGARLAEPGEFTKRAFLNGRIDILQAESVLDIIRSKTELSLKASLNTLEGHFSKKVNNIRDALLEILTNLEASIDFSEEEDVSIRSKKAILKKIKIIKVNIENLISTAGEGRILRQGLRVAICGSPNVGKSSLMNAILRESRSIVTHIPGTTRDTIEEYVNVKGLPVVLVDTAGINKTTCPIEKEGIKRSEISIQGSDLILFVMDYSRSLKKTDLDIMRRLNKKENIIVVINKKDLKKKIDLNKLKKIMGNVRIIYTSAVTMHGIDALENRIKDIVFKGKAPSSSIGNIANDRQLSLLRTGLKDVDNAIESLKKDVPLECISVYIKSSIGAIGELTGHDITEDSLDRIFSEFCIGK